MANLKDWILDKAGGEEIEGIVLGPLGGIGWRTEDAPDYEGKVMPWADAEPIVDYDFDSGYGTAGCHSLTAWTRSWIIGISEYDGSTSPFRIPRHPTDHIPDMQ